jgi:hypothetical protein
MKFLDQALLISALSICAYLSPSAVHAQFTDQTFSGHRWVAVGSGDTVQASDAFAIWNFETANDSSTTRYVFTELKKNGARILFAKWVDEALYLNWDETQLRDSSRSVCFTSSNGDTISFYRQFTWMDKQSATTREYNFYSPDTLDYVVELIKQSDGSRLLLLDSIGVLRRTTRGNPTFYGTDARLAIVKKALPAVSGDSVFVRVRASQRGDGPYNHVRRDTYGLRLSQRLNDTSWQAFAQALWRPVPQLESAPADSNKLRVSPNPSKGKIHVSFVGAESWETNLAVYDANGSLVKYPFMSRISGRAEVHFDIVGTGRFFVVLMHGTKVVSAQQVEVIN